MRIDLWINGEMDALASLLLSAASLLLLALPVLPLLILLLLLPVWEQ